MDASDKNWKKFFITYAYRFQSLFLFHLQLYIAKYLSRVYSKLLKCSNANNELTFFETGHDGYTKSCNFTIEKYNLFLLVDQTFVGELFYYTVLLHF